MADATWLEDWEEKDAEILAALAQVALEPKPRVWPISGSATKWNPNTYHPSGTGYPLSKHKPIDPFAHASEVEDERTGELPRKTT